ncbi:MAG: cytochrome c [Bacteroidetes bacterium]|nr:MAG: cytochrome c [Bacteroidota bacterium]
MKKLLSYIVPFAFVALAASCHYTDTTKPGHEYMPDMYRSPSYETYSSNPNFPDSITARHPVKGTIARGSAVYSDLDRLPYAYENTPEGYEKAGIELKNPIPLTTENLAEGKRLYFNFCQACHGETGMGDGPVVQRNGPVPPAYSSEALKNLPEGKMFHSIQYGKNMMGSHAAQLTVSQRWKIIQYVQTLQIDATASVAPANETNAAPKQ